MSINLTIDAESIVTEGKGEDGYQFYGEGGYGWWYDGGDLKEGGGELWVVTPEVVFFSFFFSLCEIPKMPF